MEMSCFPEGLRASPTEPLRASEVSSDWMKTERMLPVASCTFLNNSHMHVLARDSIYAERARCCRPSVCPYVCLSRGDQSTRKPCYRKDDRAMRPICGCPAKFRESSQTDTATFPEICKGLLFRSILRMCVQNLKFAALSVPEIIGATQKIWAVPRYAHAPFSLKFLKGFCSDGPCEYTCQI